MASRLSASYMSIDRGSRMFYRHQLAYADDSLVEHMTYRKRFRRFLFEGTHGLIIAIIEILFSLIWVGLYITDTYYKTTPKWITGLNWFFVAFFSITYFMHLFASENALRFMVSGFAIVDYITIIPYFFTAIAGVKFLQVISILRVFRLLRVMRLAPNDTVRKLFQISITLLSFVFVSTALVLVIEPDTFGDFFNSFYFMVVTIFTVGFGDVTAVTPFGKAIVILIILTGVVLIPLQAYTLARLLLTREDPLLGRYRPPPDSKHILIFGHSLKWSHLAEMINEFAVKYRIQRHMDLHIIVMQSAPPSQDLKVLTAARPDEASFIHLLKGTPLSFYDLERVSASNAECAVTLYDNDHDSCLVHMSLKSYNRKLAIFSVLQRPEKVLLYRAVAPFKENKGEVLPTILSRMEISAALLARSVATRGFATLISNLLRTRMVSFNPYEDEHAEYKRGAAYEIYFGVLPSSFTGSSFVDICISIFVQHNALLIGVMTDGKHPLINPGASYVVKGGELAIFIAPDPSVTVLIKDMQNLPLSLPLKRSKRKAQSDSNSNEDIEMSELSSSSRGRSQMKWDYENTSKLIRYHEAARNPETLFEYYRVLDSPRTYRSALVDKAPDSGGHIILNGHVLDWLYYIAPLRSRSVSKCQPIFIVTPKPLTAKQWASISHFPEIYVMPGASLLKRRYIERLNVSGATHVVLAWSGHMLHSEKSASSVPSPSTDNEEYDDDTEEAQTAFGNLPDMPDSATRDTLLIYSWINRVCPKTRVIMDIRDEIELRFLHKAERAKDSHIQQEIRNGVACATTSTVERLLAQAVYNPLVLDVTMQLIFGTRKIEDDRADGSDDDEAEVLRPLIRLEQIPSSLKSGTYRELFEEFILERNVLPLGLYRQRQRANKTRKDMFVYTCPPVDTPLEPGDRVYVLFPQIPRP